MLYKTSVGHYQSIYQYFSEQYTEYSIAHHTLQAPFYGMGNFLCYFVTFNQKSGTTRTTVYTAFFKCLTLPQSAIFCYFTCKVHHCEINCIVEEWQEKTPWVNLTNQEFLQILLENVCYQLWNWGYLRNFAFCDMMLFVHGYHCRS